jgi:hypothetical protein
VAPRRSVSEPSGSSVSGKPWHRVRHEPERWERSGFGAVEARGSSLWAMLPKCGHGYGGALSRSQAQRQLDEHDGLCFGCWYRRSVFRKALGHGHPTPPDGTPFE